MLVECQSCQTQFAADMQKCPACGWIPTLSDTWDYRIFETRQMLADGVARKEIEATLSRLGFSNLEVKDIIGTARTQYRRQIGGKVHGGWFTACSGWQQD